MTHAAVASDDPGEPVSESAEDDLFSDDGHMSVLVEIARHLRECEHCRPSLIRFAKPMAKITLAEMEAKAGRKLSEDERKTLAKAMMINASLILAAYKLHTAKEIGHQGNHFGEPRGFSGFRPPEA